MSAQHAAAESDPRWYLGFDCATKTFAFSLSRIDIAAFHNAKLRIRTQTAAITELIKRATSIAKTDPAAARELISKIQPTVDQLDIETRAFVTIVDGATVDFFPGRADKTISTVERIRAVSQYIGRRIKPAVAASVPANEKLWVVVEFQAGFNAPSRAVEHTIIALFAEEKTFIVGPLLKNMIATCEAGKYCYFAEKYSTSYGANKAHAIFNFARFEKVFGTKIGPMKPQSLRGHVADSFMQIIGHIVHGDDEKAESMF